MVVTRGRVSTAALALKAPEKLETVDRQRPPHDLTDEEVEVWSAVVSTEAADWFTPSNTPLLSQYCRHVVHARRIAELLERALSDPDLDLGSYDLLLKLQDRETKAIASLATKMRLAQQSTRTHRGNARPASASRPPWKV